MLLTLAEVPDLLIPHNPPFLYQLPLSPTSSSVPSELLWAIIASRFFLALAFMRFDGGGEGEMKREAGGGSSDSDCRSVFSLTVRPLQLGMTQILFVMNQVKVLFKTLRGQTLALHQAPSFATSWSSPITYPVDFGWAQDNGAYERTSNVNVQLIGELMSEEKAVGGWGSAKSTTVEHRRCRGFVGVMTGVQSTASVDLGGIMLLS